MQYCYQEADEPELDDADDAADDVGDDADAAQHDEGQQKVRDFLKIHYKIHICISYNIYCTVNCNLCTFPFLLPYTITSSFTNFFLALILIRN